MGKVLVKESMASGPGITLPGCSNLYRAQVQVFFTSAGSGLSIHGKPNLAQSNLIDPDALHQIVNKCSDAAFMWTSWRLQQIQHIVSPEKINIKLYTKKNN